MKVNMYYHTNLLFYNLRILKLEDLINLKTIMIMYEAKNNLLQYYRTNFKSMSVSVYGEKLWNSLNDDCKTINNEYFFKKKYKDKVFKEYQHIELQQETSAT